MRRVCELLAADAQRGRGPAWDKVASLSVPGDHFLSSRKLEINKTCTIYLSAPWPLYTSQHMLCTQLLILDSEAPLLARASGWLSKTDGLVGGSRRQVSSCFFIFSGRQRASSGAWWFSFHGNNFRSLTFFFHGGRPVPAPPGGAEEAQGSVKRVGSSRDLDHCVQAPKLMKMHSAISARP